MVIPFQPGGVYPRQRIHDEYGGQRQGGISTPKTFPAIFLFTGDAGHAYGYNDGWRNDGTFRYTGEGQVGNMTLTRGNLAIANHVANRKDLLLFEAPGPRVKYEGAFVCAEVVATQGLDRNGNTRLIYQFILVPEGDGTAPSGSQPRLGRTLAALRKQADKGTDPTGKTTKGTRNIYVRSRAVRAYVLLRAGGNCEFCGDTAPFLRPNGSPYLEPHHVERLSDGGPDDVRFVIGACPNCHASAHYGANPTGIAKKMLGRIGEIEAQL